jgi:hypothetical protein
MGKGSHLPPGQNCQRKIVAGVEKGADYRAEGAEYMNLPPAWKESCGRRCLLLYASVLLSLQLSRIFTRIIVLPMHN